MAAMKDRKRSSLPGRLIVDGIKELSTWPSAGMEFASNGCKYEKGSE